MKTDLHSELQNLVNQYTSQKDQLIAKNKINDRTNSVPSYRDGIIDDLKEVIIDLNNLLTKYHVS